MARVLAASEELTPVPAPDLRELPRGCLGEGPWGIELLAASPVPCQGGACASLRWAVVHVAQDGAVTRGPPVQGLVGARPLQLLDVSVRDLDGDGLPELVLRHAHATLGCGREGAASQRVGIWKFRDNAVLPYGEGSLRGVAGASDEDGDGLLDLRVEGEFRAEVELSCEAGGGTVVLAGLGWLAQGQRGGGFSLESEGARASHRAQCPGPPRGLVSPSREVAYTAMMAARNVTCARAWGASSGQIVEELEAGREQLCRGGGRCAVLEELRRWAQREPVVRLR
jgi:hypothetical protein